MPVVNAATSRAPMSALLEGLHVSVGRAAIGLGPIHARTLRTMARTQPARGLGVEAAAPRPAAPIAEEDTP